MKTAMIATLAATAMLLLNPCPGYSRGSHPQGTQPQAQGSYSRGSYQRGALPRGSYSQRGYNRYGGYRGAYSHGGYRGTYPYRGYRYGGYPYSGYRYGYGGYRYGGYPYYRSNVYFSGGVYLDPGWNSWWWAPVWPYNYLNYYPNYYPYYATPPVVIQQPPAEYIQKDQETEPQDYWYYCRNPEGYYPYIQRCPNGWMKVAPSAVPPDQ